MPYLYTAVRECHETGLPIMRALWLHHPDDPAAVARGDEYLWGRDMLVAPVVEKGATTRAAVSAARDLVRFLDRRARGRRPRDRSRRSISRRCRSTCARARCCRWVRSGSTSSEPSDEPTTLVVYPGADGTSSLYEDDGKTFDYRRGAFMRIVMGGENADAPSHALAGARFADAAALAAAIRCARRRSTATKRVEFAGKTITVAL